MLLLLASLKFVSENDLPEGFSLQGINEHFSLNNAGLIADLPTAHGFCMYIRRAALQEAGYFDDVLWGRGYAEENDFSLRVAKLGWRNVLAADVFVQHVGSVSFSGTAQQRIRKNLAKLNLMYPDYEVNVHHFIDSDPLAPLRGKVALSLLKNKFKQSGRQCFLFITHALGGGTEVHTQDMANKLESEGVNVLFLRPFENNGYHLGDSKHSLFAQWNENQFKEMVEALKSFNLNHIHYHHWIGFDEAIKQLPELLSCQYDVTLHDYYTVCPRVNMTSCNYRYCNTDSVDSCNKCLLDNASHPENKLSLSFSSDKISHWRERSKKFLQSARCVYAPSQDTAKRIQQFLNLNNLQVRYHPEAVKTITTHNDARSDVIVAVPGGISRNKGFDTLFSCASYAERNQLPIKFVVIGYSCDDKKLSKLSNVIITGRYERRNFKELVQKYKCDIAALFSLWPETYGYTLSESVAAGLPVLSFDIGAYAERIRLLGAGTVLSTESDTKQICNELMVLAKNHSSSLIKIGNEYLSLLSDYYKLNPV